MIAAVLFTLFTRNDIKGEQQLLFHIAVVGFSYPNDPNAHPSILTSLQPPPDGACCRRCLAAAHACRRSAARLKAACVATLACFTPPPVPAANKKLLLVMLFMLRSKAGPLSQSMEVAPGRLSLLVRKLCSSASVVRGAISAAVVTQSFVRCQARPG